MLLFGRFGLLWISFKDRGGWGMKMGMVDYCSCGCCDSITEKQGAGRMVRGFVVWKVMLLNDVFVWEVWIAMDFVLKIRDWMVSRRE